MFTELKPTKLKKKFDSDFILMFFFYNSVYSNVAVVILASLRNFLNKYKGSSDVQASTYKTKMLIPIVWE